MQIIIDTERLSRRGININEYLLLLSIYSQQNNKSIDYIERKADYLSLQSKGYLSLDGAMVSLLPRSLYLIEGIGRDYTQLATDIRECFPRGSKDGKYPWRGTIKIIVDKLRKLDKGHGMGDYTNDQILTSCREYVSNFNQMTMDRGMQIAPYFIEKDGNSTLMAWLEKEDEVITTTKSMEIKL
jgi:hypothetical protein